MCKRGKDEFNVIIGLCQVSQWAASPVRLTRAQALSLALSIIDNSVENQGPDLSLTLSFIKGACLSIIPSNKFVKYSNANLLFQKCDLYYCQQGQ